MGVKGFLEPIYLFKLHDDFLYFFKIHRKISFQNIYQLKNLQQFFIIEEFDFLNQYFTFFLQYFLEFQ